ncbi:MAG: hypothetical protein IPF92_07610 [Myxococcales bacterium]|nr:hypothetical protein [Myxococcales bacterium]
MCREVRITRETGYKWLARFEAEGIRRAGRTESEAGEHASRRPRGS